jgi:hypothetical protein
MRVKSNTIPLEHGEFWLESGVAPSTFQEFEMNKSEMNFK